MLLRSRHPVTYRQVDGVSKARHNDLQEVGPGFLACKPIMSTPAANSFDPYHRWLGIPPKHQPPHHYRLLGVDVFESDPDVIQSATDRQMTHVRSFQTGQHGQLTQQVLNELSTAKLCLLDLGKKAEYDERLQAKLAADRPAAALPEPAASAVVPMPVEPKLVKPLPVGIPMPAHVGPGPPGLTPKPNPTPVVRGQPSWTGVQLGKPGGTQSKTRRERRMWIILGLAAAAGLVLLFAIFFALGVSSDRGELVIECDELNVELLVNRGGQTVETVHVDENKKRISIRSGTYQIAFAEPDAKALKIDKQEVSVVRGRQVVVSITRRDPRTLPRPPRVIQPLEVPPPVVEKEPPEQQVAPTATQRGAVVEVSRMKEVPFGPIDQLPGKPGSAVTFTWVNKPKSTQLKNGVLEFTVKQSGVVYLVTSTEFQGSPRGPWVKERLSKDQLVQRGWTNLGRCPWRPKETLLSREVKEGESYRIRTNKYGPPRLILPARPS